MYFYLILTTTAVLISVNAQGLRSPDRRKTAFSYFLRYRLDIILLQETHWTVDMEMQIKREWNGDVIFNHGMNNARGVAILIHSRLDYTVIQTRGDNEGRGSLLEKLQLLSESMISHAFSRDEPLFATFFRKVDQNLDT